MHFGQKKIKKSKQSPEVGGLMPPQGNKQRKKNQTTNIEAG